MDRFLSIDAAVDWLLVAVLALVPALMVFGLHSIRTEVRAVARFEARAVKLKTTQEQRRRWRQASQSKDLLNLLDDIDILLNIVKADEDAARQAHKEAVRLFRMSWHIPVRTLLLGSLLFAGVLSAILMVLAQGPVNSIP